MILDIECKSVELSNILYIVRSIMNILMIAAPILAIIFLAILLTKKVMDPDEKKTTNKIKNLLNALVVLFFIPAIVNVTMFMLGSKTDFSSCYTTAQRVGQSTSYVPVEDDEGKTKIVEDREYESGYVHQLDFSCKSKYINAQFSCDTIHIVEHHFQDFNYYTKDSVIASYGGFDKWIDSLGGVFKEYYNKDVPTPTKAYEFQKISEYVFGLLYIHGVDYFNGKNMQQFDEGTHYCKWGGSCFYLKDLAAAQEEAARTNTPLNFKWPVGSKDAFYPGDMIYGDHGYMNGRDFDSAIAGKLMTTNCNNSVDLVYFKAHILGTKKRPYGSASFKAMGKDPDNKIITDFKDVQIGDILHFYRSPVDPANPDTWTNWGHVAYVGEINYQTGVITAYDGGSYLMVNRNHKWTFNRNKTTSSLGGFEGWSIVRVVDLT